MKDLESVKKFLKQYNVNVKDINENTNVKDLGIDSLDLMMIVLDIEKKYNLNLDDKTLLNIKTVGDLLNLMKNK